MLFCQRRKLHQAFYERYAKTHPVDKKQIKWWHKIAMPDGTLTPGYDVSDYRYSYISTMLPDLRGKSVLDVGAWDGYFSFKAEQLGASRVLATDHFCWSGPGWGSKAGFDYAKEALASKVESLDIDVPDICPETVGHFDVILMFGVLYHLPSILTSFVNVSECCNEWMVIETLEDRIIQQDIPLMRFYAFNDCHQDHTNWFVPNPAAVRDMLRYAGFSDLQEKHYSVGNDCPRGIYVARRTTR